MNSTVDFTPTRDTEEPWGERERQTEVERRNNKI